MARIIYVMFSNGRGTGGQKMILRHVETLRHAGFDALCWLPSDNSAPTWFEHTARIVSEPHLRPDDIVVLPDDYPKVIEKFLPRHERLIVFSQGPYLTSNASADLVESSAARFDAIIGVGGPQVDLLRRILPRTRVELIQAFADERRFFPGAPKKRQVLYSRRKRPHDAEIILGLVKRLSPDLAGWDFVSADDLAERQMARAMSESAIFLSLQKRESVGLTALEAMASGCLCTGFTGIGGWAYANEQNGLWVAEEDCLAAAEAVSEAIILWNADSARRASLIAGGLLTAQDWSYGAFQQQLLSFWRSMLSRDA